MVPADMVGNLLNGFDGIYTYDSENCFDSVSMIYCLPTVALNSNSFHQQRRPAVILAKKKEKQNSTVTDNLLLAKHTCNRIMRQ